MFSIITHAATLIVGILLGGFIYKANNIKSEKFLNELAAKAALGTEEAKAAILTQLSNLKK